MTTEEFKNYLINYFEKKRKKQLYMIFLNEFKLQRLHRRTFSE